MKHLQFKADIDEENGVVSLKRSSTFEAYKVSRECSSVITSKKSPYAEKFMRYGVYILVQDDGVNPFKFYVGKAGKVSQRFISHVGKHAEEKTGLKWTDAILFISTSESFPWGEDEIAWFEYWLLQDIIAANRYVYTNNPEQTKEGIVDEDECDHQLADMELLVSLLGYPKLFIASDPKSSGNDNSHGADVAKAVPTVEKHGTQKSIDAVSIKAYESFPYSAAGLAFSLVQKLAKDGEVTPKVLKMLTTKDSSDRFRMQRANVFFLKSHTGDDEDVRDEKGRSRYGVDTVVTIGGKKYWVSKEFFPASYLPLMTWAKEYGLDEKAVLALCDGSGVRKRKGF